MALGKFITFEGGEGAGKSTQIPILAEHLRNRGIDVVETREPGGVDSAERLREVLLEPVSDAWDPLAEVLLLYAARREHVIKLIKPALKAGAWVLCDRFADSTMAYQGYGSGVDRDLIERIHAATLGEFQPDLTMIFDLPVDVGMKRAGARGTADRYEQMGMEFHENMRLGLLEIARDAPDRCIIIDANVEINLVSASILAAVGTRFE